MTIIPWPPYRLIQIRSIPRYYCVFSSKRYLGSIRQEAEGQPWTAYRELKALGQASTRGGAAALLRPAPGDWRPVAWELACVHCGCQAGCHRSDDGKCPPVRFPGVPLPPDLPPLDWKSVESMEAWYKAADVYWGISTTHYQANTN